jgi:hypothetical protein
MTPGLAHRVKPGSKGKAESGSFLKKKSKKTFASLGRASPESPQPK